jgi:protein SCO1/2
VRPSPPCSPALATLLLAGLVAAAACSRTSPAPSDGSRRYPLAGRVEAVDPANGRASVSHEDIPGFMPAMTMEFTILDAAVLAARRPGDRIRATLVIAADNRSWLEGVTVTGHAPVPTSPSASPAAGGKPGDPLPAVTLLDQDGQALELSSYRGQALAVTFIFTRCPMPEYCPMITSRFAEAARALAADPVLRDRARLLSVSFDTRFDRPPVLRDYGARFQPKSVPPFTLWRLATGEPEQVRRLAQFAGLDYVEEQGTFTHTMRTAVVGPDGRLRSLRRGSDWPAAGLVADLRAALE